MAGPLTIDLDSTIVAVHGRAKQGAAFGYTGVRGYHPQLATCAQTGQVLMSRLRGGSAGAARGAASFLTSPWPCRPVNAQNQCPIVAAGRRR